VAWPEPVGDPLADPDGLPPKYVVSGTLGEADRT
jgi:hypothetical protein